MISREVIDSASGHQSYLGEIEIMRLPITYEFMGDYDLDFDLDRQSASEIPSIESVPGSKLSSNLVQIAIGNFDRLICPTKSDLVVMACTFKAPLCVGCVDKLPPPPI